MSSELQAKRIIENVDRDKCFTALRDVVTECIDNEMRHGCDRGAAIMNVGQLLAAFVDHTEAGIWPIPDHDKVQ